MTGSGDLSSFESSLGEVFRKMGLPDPGVLKTIMEDWESVAGDPWAGRSKPIIVHGDTLIVEASRPSLVAFLRYAEGDLLASLEALLGKGKIRHIEVHPPPRR